MLGWTFCLRFLEAPAQYSCAESQGGSCVSGVNRQIRKRWRVVQDQEHENIKCSKINLLDGSSHWERIFGAG